VSSQTQMALTNAIDESFVSSFRLVSLICTILALASALSAWLLVAGKQPAPAGSTLKESGRATHQDERAKKEGV